MGIFWNRNSAAGNVVYTRSRKQIRSGLMIMTAGFFLIVVSFIFQGLGKLSVAFFLRLAGSIIVAVDVIMVSQVNFLLLYAKIKGKKYVITRNKDGDKVIFGK